MQIRNSILNTKKFFQKTFGNFKSFFSSPNHYQKIPKSAPNYNNPFSYFAQDMNNNTTQQSYKGLDSLYLDHFTDQSDSISKKKIKSSTLSNPDDQRGQQLIQSCRSFNKTAELSRSSSSSNNNNNEKERKEANNSNNKRLVKSRGLVTEKLKELEMMDMSNLDHVLDLEEVIHYYSRLTCPFYLEIVDNFFMEFYNELFGNSNTTTSSISLANVKDSRVLSSKSTTMRSW